MTMKQTIFDGILGGICIGLGCLGYISVDNPYMGAFLFCIGLVTICIMHWGLFTGYLCGSRSPKLIGGVLLGNVIGIYLTYIMGYLSGANLEKAYAIGQNKMNRPLHIPFVSGMLCEICIYIAIIGYWKSKTEIGKLLSIILGVMVFILCGFEHSIADLFYVPLISPKAIVFWIVVALGNIVGALIMRLLDRRWI